MRAPKITSLLLIALLAFAACGGSSPSDPPEDTPEYTVTFNANNGSENTTLKVTEGGKLTAPAEPVKNGYGFGGWYEDGENFTDEWNFTTDTVTADITLYAKWGAVYTVTFNAGNGTPNTTQKVTEGRKATAPVPAPVRENYGFGGWYEDGENFTDEWDFDANTVTADITLYAKWTDTYTVRFMNGGTLVSTITDVTKGDKVTAPDLAPVEGHTLDGWYRGAGFTTKWNFDTDTVTADTTLYAKWNPIPYTVTFNGNGSTPPSYTETINYGEKITAPNPEPVKDGYVFDGWYRDNDTFEDEWDFTTGTVKGDTTLYAKWLILYTVTFDAGNGTPDTTQKIAEGGKVTVPSPAPTREGYAFAGWYREADFVSMWSFVSGTVNTDITLYAAWRSPEDIEDFGPNAVVNKVFEAAAAEDWNDALTAIKGGGSSRNYVININAPFSIEGSATDTFGDPSGLKVSIRGGSIVFLNLSGAKGSALRIRSGQTVIVRDTVFAGRTDNDDPLMYLSEKGELTLKGSASIKANTNTSGRGGGVYIYKGTFTMQDTASVSGNEASSGNSSYGGGVYVGYGTFTMHDKASVSDNRAYGGTSLGGGVYMVEGSFTMWEEASVSGNRATTPSPNNYSNYSYGGGVCVDGVFTMRDTASVSGNTVYHYGGGVCVKGGGIFRIEGGTIYGNNEDTDSNFVKKSTSGPSINGCGAALYHDYYYDDYYGVAYYGTFDAAGKFSINGNLGDTDATIQVIEGDLIDQPDSP